MPGIIAMPGESQEEPRLWWSLCLRPSDNLGAYDDKFQPFRCFHVGQTFLSVPVVKTGIINACGKKQIFHFSLMQPNLLQIAFAPHAPHKFR
jgi:hypothetical protein